MSILKRLGRLFTIRTRWEAWAVIWAITLGAVERGKAYMEVYPGATGWLFFIACAAVVFVAGGKLLDSVRPAPQARTAPVLVRRANRRHPSPDRSRSFRRSGSLVPCSSSRRR